MNDWTDWIIPKITFKEIFFNPWPKKNSLEENFEEIFKMLHPNAEMEKLAGKIIKELHLPRNVIVLDWKARASLFCQDTYVRFINLSKSLNMRLKSEHICCDAFEYDVEEMGEKKIETTTFDWSDPKLFEKLRAYILKSLNVEEPDDKFKRFVEYLYKGIYSFAGFFV